MILCVPKQFLGVRDVSELTCSRNLERYSEVTGARRTGVGDSSNASHQFRCAPKRFIPPIFNSQWYTSCEFSSIKSRMNKTSSSGVCFREHMQGNNFYPTGKPTSFPIVSLDNSHIVCSVVMVFVASVVPEELVTGVVRNRLGCLRLLSKTLRINMTLLIF